jgi:cold shock CspA family protein
METNIAEKRKGVCKWFNSTNGFGFIIPDDGSREIFVHQTGIIADGFRSLREGEKVEYNVTEDETGREKAIDVTGPEGKAVLGAIRPKRRYPRRRRNKTEKPDSNNAESGKNGKKPENKEDEAKEKSMQSGQDVKNIENSIAGITLQADNNVPTN